MHRAAPMLKIGNLKTCKNFLIRDPKKSWRACVGRLGQYHVCSACIHSNRWRVTLYGKRFQRAISKGTTGYRPAHMSSRLAARVGSFFGQALQYPKNSCLQIWYKSRKWTVYCAVSFWGREGRLGIVKRYLKVYHQI